MISLKKEELIIGDLVEQKTISRNEQNGNYEIDIIKLRESNVDLYEEFLRNPEPFIESIKKQLDEYFNVFKSKEFLRELRLRIKNFGEIHPISFLRVFNLGKLVKVIGMVAKTTKVIALVKQTTWECALCGAAMTTQGVDKPHKCICRAKTPLFREIGKELQDVQEIELEELQDTIEGRQPQKIRVRLLDDLCDKEMSGILQPGNKVEVLGVVQELALNNKKIQEEIFEYRILAYNVISLEEKYNDVLISDEDLRQIKEIALNNPLDRLSISLAPSVYGHSEIKKALVLQMAGGVKSFKQDGSSFRNRLHILLCGEPSTGKTHLGKSVHKRMPKSYYISGDETTKAGLVAIVDKDVLTGNWCLKAGALSKAEDSILIIDELDKLNEEDRKGMHTPMESGEIIISKADIHSKLNADCAILGIANPVDGMFNFDDPNKPIAKQVNLPPAIMSRFDLVFVMSDKVDETNDSSIVDMIYSGKKTENIISIELFRKYISYARKFKPRLLEENKQMVNEFYAKVRKQSMSKDSRIKAMPISSRHLEGIIRLAQASAKIRLSETVTIEDLKVAQDLFYNSLLKLGMDEGTGLIDLFKVTGEGRTVNRRMKAEIIMEVMREILTATHWEFVKDDYLKEKCIEKGVNKWEYANLIYELNRTGEILAFQNGWQLTK